MYVSLFSYALTVYDSRWLYRLAARDFTAKEFATVFGGGGEKRQKVLPVRPPGEYAELIAAVFITSRHYAD